MTRIEEIEARKAEIALELDKEGADIDALDTEVRKLNKEIEELRAKAEKKAELRKMVAAGKVGTTVRTMENEEAKTEVRNTKAYINAYANYIKTGKDAECRSLLSTNATEATGYVPVPDLVDARVRTAWEKNEVMNLVRKTYLKGNVKVGFELSATGAVVHSEGADAPAEEVITLGIVTMTPSSIKKWITVSDEALDLSGEEFLNYIFDELTYRIAKKAEEDLMTILAALPTAATSTSVSAEAINMAPTLTTIATAMGSVVGSNLHVVMNRATYAVFKAAQYAANFSIDIFEGLPVVFSDALPAYNTASTGNVYAIVGDFYEGAQVNFPGGDQITIKKDDLSLAEKDLVKFVGREFVGMGAVADKRFALLKKPATV